MAKNMKAIAQDMRMAVGSPSISDPASKWKEVQMALGQSELDARQEQQRIRMIQLVEQIATNLQKRADNNGMAAATPGRRRP